MVKNNVRILERLNEEIRDLEEEIRKTKNANEILKLDILKKELLLQKLEFDGAI